MKKLTYKLLSVVSAMPFTVLLVIFLPTPVLHANEIRVELDSVQVYVPDQDPAVGNV